MSDATRYFALQPRRTTIHVGVLALLGLLAPLALADEPGLVKPIGGPKPADGVDSFRNLTPAERLRDVEKQPGGRGFFLTAMRGDLVVSVVELASEYTLKRPLGEVERSIRWSCTRFWSGSTQRTLGQPWRSA